MGFGTLSNRKTRRRQQRTERPKQIDALSRQTPDKANTEKDDYKTYVQQLSKLRKLDVGHKEVTSSAANLGGTGKGRINPVVKSWRNRANEAHDDCAGHD